MKTRVKLLIEADVDLSKFSDVSEVVEWTAVNGDITHIPTPASYIELMRKLSESAKAAQP